MKIRLAKKIMKAHDYMMQQAVSYDALWHIPYLGYWTDRWLKYRGFFVTPKYVRFYNRDHRITKAISLTRRWRKRNIVNNARKLNEKHPFELSDIKQSATKLREFRV